ncbi:hypothetical protein EIP86_005636 [Pleurotus ostreatoroseus]|nr:hypothetical protein EIP86_005636 [Pleurotus ostreatoroseus]
MVLLAPCDGEPINVTRQVAEHSVVLKNMLEDLGEGDQPIPLPNVSCSILRKVLEYCEHHCGEPLPAVDPGNEDYAYKQTMTIDEWDSNFLDVDQELLFQIIIAANYLEIKPLLDAGCKTVANMMRGKTTDELRIMFNIGNDFTPEEETEAALACKWVEDR